MSWRKILECQHLHRLADLLRKDLSGVNELWTQTHISSSSVTPTNSVGQAKRTFCFLPEFNRHEGETVMLVLELWLGSLALVDFSSVRDWIAPCSIRFDSIRMREENLPLCRSVSPAWRGASGSWLPTSIPLRSRLLVKLVDANDWNLLFFFAQLLTYLINKSLSFFVIFLLSLPLF